jgi:hypothetical protein
MVIVDHLLCEFFDVLVRQLVVSKLARLDFEFAADSGLVYEVLRGIRSESGYRKE